MAERIPEDPAKSSQQPLPAGVITGFDLGATSVFALEGALLGLDAGLDVLGIVVAGFVTALGGGILRDVLLGDVPPAGLRYKSYVGTAAFWGLLVAAFSGQISDVPADLLAVLDAAGLSAYAVAGAGKALDFGMNSLTAVLMGVLTAVGGGLLRDVLLNVVPAVLIANFYATAALAGALLMVVGVRLGQPAVRMMYAGALFCFALRLAGYFGDWALPHP